MELIFVYVTVAYTVFFLSMGLVLLTAYTPHDKKLAPYVSGRRVFAAAFLLIGITGATDLIFLPDARLNGYAQIYVMSAVSMIHAALNGYAYLLLQESSERSFHLFRRYIFFFMPMILLVGAVMLLDHSVTRLASFMMGAVYAIQILWTVYICRKEYLASVRAMENFSDGSLRFSWMNGVLNMTLGLALINLMSFYFVELCLLLRIMSTLFYLYFAIRLMNYASVFEQISETRKEEMNCEEVIAKANIFGNGRLVPAEEQYCVGLAEAIELWCKSKRYCRDSLTIKMVAREIGTNHTYLSVYLNKYLGCTFQKWLHNLRIEEAKTILRMHPYKPVKEISSMVGIPQSYNFSRWFKQITNISPNQWRSMDLAEELREEQE